VNIFVCIKQIQDPELATELFRIDEEKKEVIPIRDLPFVTSPFDEQAIEAALRIRDRIGDAGITVGTFGPKSFQPAIKRALSMGADAGILISDEGLEELDAYGTASVLCAAIKKAGKFDLILAGRQAADWDAGIVGCGIAELLGIPVITFAKDLHLEGDHVVVERVLDEGFETVRTTMPCLVTVSNELGTPRKPSLRETMRAAKKPQAVWDTQGLGLTKDSFGAQERRQTRERLFKPTKDSVCELFTGESPHEIATRVATRLSSAKLI
jgi:electron transfer flavoprotein beta subunit